MHWTELKNTLSFVFLSQRELFWSATLTLEMKQKQCVLSVDFQQFRPSQIKY